jgi:hypothetical protein
MSNVIKGEFGQKKAAARAAPGPEKERPNAGGFLGALGKMLVSTLGIQEGADLVGLGVRQLQVLEMLRYIEGLEGYRPSKEIQATEEANWKTYSDEGLTAAVASSTQADWGKSPNRYVALANECKRRDLRKLDEDRTK